MKLSFSWEYLSFIVFFGLIWLAFFWMRRDLRKEMILMSLLCVPLGPLADLFYMRDYYLLPVLNGASWYFFSAILGGLHGGVTAVLYESVYKVHFAIPRRKTLAHPRWFWVVLIAGSLIMLFGTAVLRVNSIYVSILVMLVGGASILYYRPDLTRDALGSGVLLVLISFAFYLGFQYLFPTALAAQWLVADLSGELFFGVPVEELLWAFAWGFIAGPAYEYVLGGRIYSRRKRP